MLKIYILLLALIVLPPATTIAQVTVLDAIFTPAGYPDTPLWARIHIPDPANSRGIGVVMTHGYTAPPTGNQFWRDSLVADGYLVMAVEHPDMDAVPDGLYPKLVRASKTAVQFLRHNDARFGITTGKIVAWGQSQGSMIWGQTIIWDNDHSFFGTDSTIDDHLDGAILLYGLYDMFNYMPGWVYSLLTTHFSLDPSLRSTRGQCLTNVSNITTPVLLLHATGDPIAYIQHSRMLRDSLNFYGRFVRHIEFNSSLHTFDALSDTEFSALGLVAKDSALAFLDVLFPTSVRQLPTDVPSAFILAQNYPNPFNPSTTIQFSLPHSEFVTLRIFNVLGEQIATLVSEKLSAGTHQAEWHPQSLSSGVYFYRIKAGSFADTKRLLLLK